MYSTSATFQTLIKDNIRTFHWSGVINTPTPISFTDENIISGELTRSISGDKLEIGSVYASQLTIEVDLSGVSRYELYGCTMTLAVKLEGATDVIPMGEFIITEALQSASKISITAFDNMIKFDDVSFVPAQHTTIQKPYAWLSEMCTACGVTLGSTSADIGNMPNGKRPTGYTDIASDVNTWRDVLGYLGAYMGGFAYIGRDGKLYMGLYGSISADTVPSSFRYTSQLSDFRTTYDGVYNLYKEDGLQEYVANTNTGGLVLDLGANPFLQFTRQSNRQKALQEIIDAWNGIYYIPYASEMPLVPCYDPADVLTFIDNQAGVYDIGAITEITYTIGGAMSVTCGGDNPRLSEAQDRFTKTLEGIANEYDNTRNIGNKEFWILSVKNDTSSLTVGSAETQITEIEWNQKTTVQDVEMIVEIDAVLSATAEVQIRMTVDDDATYESVTNDIKILAGEKTFVRTNPQKVEGVGTHTAKVYMIVTDSALLVGDLE